MTNTILAGLALAALLLAWIYRVRPDAAAAITVFPVWIWVPPALLLLLVLLRSRPWRSGLVLLIWLVFLLGSGDEPSSLARGALSTPPSAPDAQRLRVITFNCGGVNTTAELIAHHPDILLLQESPSSEAVAQFGAELFGQAAIVWTNDATLVADGELLTSPDWNPRGACCSRARVRLRKGPTVEVVSLRLVPPLVRWDLWSPDCWRAQAENRRQRRGQLGDFLTHWTPEVGSLPVILGGDFNAPAGDGAMDVLRPQLAEAGRAAGRGWGNTITNEFPVLRIDQVWTSPDFEAVNVTAHLSRGSDHRFVICDLRIKALAEPPVP